MSNPKRLSRNQRITIVGIAVTAVLTILGWFVASSSKPKQPQRAVIESGSGSPNTVINGNNNTVVQSPPIHPSDPRAADAAPRKKPQTAIGRKANQEPAQIQIANAPNGIAIAGGTVNNPTVINGPPPVEIRFDASPVASADSQFQYQVDVKISVNSPYTPVSLAFVCDFEIKNISFDFGQSGSVTFNNRVGTDAQNTTIGFVYFEGTAVTPERPLYVHIWAAQAFRVIEVRPAKLTN